MTSSATTGNSKIDISAFTAKGANIKGGDGKNTLIGGAGADILTGGAKADTTGGAGADTFIGLTHQTPLPTSLKATTSSQLQLKLV